MARRKKRVMNKHHIKPRARFWEGEDVNTNNIVHIDIDFHRNWHKLFGILTPEEAIAFIRIVMQPGRKWNKRKLQQLRNTFIHGGTTTGGWDG